MSLAPAQTSGTQGEATQPPPNWHATHAEADKRLKVLMRQEWERAILLRY